MCWKEAKNPYSQRLHPIDKTIAGDKSCKRFGKFPNQRAAPTKIRSKAVKKVSIGRLQNFTYKRLRR